MTRIDIINDVAAKTGIEKLTIKATLDAIVKTMMAGMAKGDNIYLREFGTFIVKKRAERVARNVFEGKTIIVPEHYFPTFKPSKEFAKEVAKSKKGHITKKYNK